MNKYTCLNFENLAEEQTELPFNFTDFLYFAQQLGSSMGTY